MKRCCFLSAVFGLLFLIVRGAAAHAELRSAVPEPGSSLNEQPEEIRLTFSEAVGPGSTITLFGEGFREVEGLEARVDPEQAEVLVTAVPDLAPGTYSVNWMVLSTDGHPASGSYTFAVLPGAERGYITGVLIGTVAAAVVLGLAIWLLKRYFDKRGKSASVIG